MSAKPVARPRTHALEALFGSRRAVIGVIHREQPGAWLLITGGLVYFVGMFGMTMLFNVPLNNLLAASPSDANTWRRYLTQWTRWNHVRTLTSLAASAMFVAALKLM